MSSISVDQNIPPNNGDRTDVESQSTLESSTVAGSQRPDFAAPRDEGIGDGRAPSRSPFTQIWRRHFSFHSFPFLKHLPSLRRSKSVTRPDFFVRKLEDHPAGYPRLAAYIDSDTNFNIYRRFGFLRNRVLLHTQAELVELESQLEGLDELDEQEEEEILKSKERDDSQAEPERKLLLEQIDTKLKQYDDLLLRSQETLAMKKPTQRNITSYFLQIRNTGSLVKSESRFILHKRDLVTLAANQEDSWLNGAVEDAMIATSRGFTQSLFGDKEQLQQTTDPHLHYYSKRRLDAFVALIVAIIASGLGMVPVFYFSTVNSDGNVKNAVALAFMFCFAASLSIFTNAKRHEAFAVIVAYGAILVVFLNAQIQLGSQGAQWNLPIGNFSQIYQACQDFKTAVTTQFTHSATKIP
ncbi:MAG: hypothetical protein M1812_003609 [Candelaria pacifica]|nr:MAG: hypothetical protein M1812_003609 [Candelaria pacifica]